MVQYLSLAAVFVGGLLILSWIRGNSRRDRYAEYLKSKRWEELRHQAMGRDGKRCRICNRSYRLQVHHRAYPAVWGRETVDDLTTLCNECHALVSKSEAQRRIYGR